MRTLIKVLLIILPLGTIFESADLFRKIGIVFYPEQFYAALFGLAATLVYLFVPAGKGRQRTGPVPWYDIIAAIISFVAWIYIAINYPRFSEFSTGFPISGVVVAFVVIVLLLEGLRRTSGLGITFVALGFLILGLVSHFLPGTMTGRQVDLDRLFYYLTWDSTAILGMPLKVIATIVVSFMMFGEALSRTGGASFFTDFAMVAMGKYRGGPAKISVISSALFGTISGSAVANVVADGIVTIPSATTFATALPEIVPKRAEETTEILAGPPRYFPMATMAKSVKKDAPPVRESASPNIMKETTMVAMIFNGIPRIAVESQVR